MVYHAAPLSVNSLTDLLDVGRAMEWKQSEQNRVILKLENSELRKLTLFELNSTFIYFSIWSKREKSFFLNKELLQIRKPSLGTKPGSRLRQKYFKFSTKTPKFYIFNQKHSNRENSTKKNFNLNSLKFLQVNIRHKSV